MGKIAFLYAGQGAQYPGMAKDLYEEIPEVKELLDAAEAIRPGTLSQMFAGTEEELKRTDNTQPCVFLADLAAATALRAKGIKPDVVAGFSLGEIAAIAEAGVLDAEDAFRLVVSRGARMQAASHTIEGSMIAVLRMDAGELRGLCAEYGVYPVNFNCPGQIVVSGEKERVDALKAVLTEKGTRFVELAVGGPFHTPYMKEASEGLREDLAKLPVTAPKLPLYSNRTAQPYPDDAESIRNTLAEQICNSVLWEDTIRNMAEAGVDTFIECGPGKTLAGLVKKTLSGVTICSVGDVAALAKVTEVQE